MFLCVLEQSKIQYGSKMVVYDKDKSWLMNKKTQVLLLNSYENYLKHKFLWKKTSCVCV